jgi:dTDP-4-dehydrorhamnose 3,5-epimerase
MEGKLVRCIRGRVHDVMVDIRPGSATFAEQFGVELSAELVNAVYIPPGFAHGFQSLEDDTEVLYQMTDFYVPSLGGGFRFDDRTLGVNWPTAVTVVADRDRDAPGFSQEKYLSEYQQRLTQRR